MDGRAADIVCAGQISEESRCTVHLGCITYVKNINTGGHSASSGKAKKARPEHHNLYSTRETWMLDRPQNPGEAADMQMLTREKKGEKRLIILRWSRSRFTNQNDHHPPGDRERPGRPVDRHKGIKRRGRPELYREREV